MLMMMMMTPHVRKVVFFIGMPAAAGDPSTRGVLWSTKNCGDVRDDDVDDDDDATCTKGCVFYWHACGSRRSIDSRCPMVNEELWGCPDNGSNEENLAQYRAYHPIYRNHGSISTRIQPQEFTLLRIFTTERLELK